jgi:uncharacterized repeat protein (TIGR03943 family)
MDDRTQGALLLAVGGVALRLGLTDAALAYVKAGLQPLLVISGLVLVILGGTAVWRAFRTPDEPEPHDASATTATANATAAATEGAACPMPAADDHGHHPHGPVVAWMLVLPLLALLLVAPPPLGSFAAGRQSSRPPVTTQTSFNPLPQAEGGAVPLSMSEYVFRALYDRDASLDGARVRLTGFVTPDEGAEGYLLTRFLVSCCAADGQAISVEIRDDGQPRTADTWLEVEGHWEPRAGHEPGTLSTEPPVLVAESVRPIEAPTQPYEY